MKLDTNVAEKFERVNIKRESEFTIKASAQAFSILSSGLYSDKILAVCRELMTNAIDGHIKANNTDSQFDVHLPSALEPWYSVYDYGTGLSEDQIFSLYSTYFDSDKNDTNDLIGGLGLGSKSPLSYTSVFEVLSRQNGIKKIYSVFLNEDNLPTILKLGEMNTLEPNGLEVKFQINKEDFTSFLTKSVQASYFYRIQPNFVNGDPKKLFEAKQLFGNEYKVRFKTDNFNFIGVSYNTNSIKHTLVQGGVPYSFLVHDFIKNYVDDKDQSQWTLLFQAMKPANSFSYPNILTYEDIGSFDFTPNREGLQMTQKTIGLILNRWTQIREHFTQLVLSTLNTHRTGDNLFNLFLKIDQLRMEHAYYFDFGVFAKSLVVNNASPEINIGLEYLKKSEIFTKNQFDLKNITILVKPIGIELSHKFDLLTLYPSSAKGYKVTSYFRNVPFDSEVFVVYNDLKVGKFKIAQNFLKQQKGTKSQFDRVMIITPRTDNKSITKEQLQGEKEVFESVYNTKFKLLSSFQEKTASTTKSVNNYTKYNMYLVNSIWNKPYYNGNSNKLVDVKNLLPKVTSSDLETMDLTKGGVYFILDNQVPYVSITLDNITEKFKYEQVIDTTKPTIKENLQPILDYGVKTGLISNQSDLPVVMASSATITKLKKLGNWVDFGVLLSSFITNHLIELAITLKMEQILSQKIPYSHLLKIGDPNPQYRDLILFLLSSGEFDEWKNKYPNNSLIRDAEDLLDAIYGINSNTFIKQHPTVVRLEQYSTSFVKHFKYKEIVLNGWSVSILKCICNFPKTKALVENECKQIQILPSDEEVKTKYPMLTRLNVNQYNSSYSPNRQMNNRSLMKDIFDYMKLVDKS